MDFKQSVARPNASPIADALAGATLPVVSFRPVVPVGQA